MKKSFLLIIAFWITSSSISFGQHFSFTEGFSVSAEQETQPVRIVKNGGASYFEIGYNFTGAYISETFVNGNKYQFLSIEGFAKMQQVGAPALPAHNEIIAMPEKSTGKVVILNTEYVEYEGFNIHPALEPARDTEGAPGPEFKKDEAIYGTDEFFPKDIIEITDILLSRETPLAVSQIRPVQFNPVTGKIRVYTKISYRIEFFGGVKSFNNISENNSLVYTNLLKRNVINSKSIPDGIPYKNANSKAGEKNYIIITHSEYLAQANQLANWKRQMGYSVEVVSQSSWTADQVKTEIHDRYNSWTPKPDYFVIIGDHDGAYAVPGEIHQDPSDGEDFATDLYAACMDGGSDWIPDMAHGRISVSSSAEAQVIIDKIINYELNPINDANFYQNALNCAQYQDVEDSEPADGYAARRFCQTSENIRDYLQNDQGYVSERVYYTSTSWDVNDLHYNDGYYSTGGLLPSELRDVSFDWSGGSADITSAIDAGKFLVFHRDHGYVGGSGWAHPYYTTSSMPSLANNDKLPVVFSMNCHTGEYQLSNCFAEKFLRMEDKGAVGVVGAAYYSYSGYNDALSLGMIDAIWSDPGLYGVFGTGGTGTNYTIGAGNDLFTMGDVVNQGLYAMVLNWGNNKYTHELFHWFGDPAMKIWTANPNDNVITATHVTDIDCNATSFSITGSTASALATLVYNNGLIAETTLDGSGNGTITYAITAPGATATLTISKHNNKPYTSTLNVTGTCAFPPAVITYDVTDITAVSATGNCEITNDFGSTITESGFVYSLNPSPEIGNAGIIQLQTSPTVTTGTYSIGISSLDPNTKYYYRAYALNDNGTGYGDDKTFTTSCGTINTLPFSEDFSAGILPGCWENIDNEGSGQVWEFNNPGGRTINTASSGNGFAILDSDHYGSGSSQDADLITPTMDLSAYTSVNLYFEHYFQFYSGSSATFAYSINGGTSWNTIETWASTTDNPILFDQDVSTEVAGQADVKFKWNYTGSWGWYWAIDDISITGVSQSEWTGTTSSDWNDVSNWDGGKVPVNVTDVTIPATAANWLLIDGDCAIGSDCNSLLMLGASEITINGNLTINPGKQIHCDADATIKVTGNWTNSGTFIPGTSTVYFDGNTSSTISESKNSEGGLVSTSHEDKEKLMDGKNISFHHIVVNKSGDGELTTGTGLNIGGNFTIKPGAHFTNASGNTITVTNDLTLEADVNSTASFIDEGTTTVTSNTYVQYYCKSDLWHFISGCFYPAGNHFDDLFTGNIPTAFYRWDESHFEGSSTGWWIDILHSGEWETGTFNASQGYAISDYTKGTIYSLSGDLYNSTKTLNMTKTTASVAEGWNLVGNPFPCSMAANSNTGTSNNFIVTNTSVLDASFVALYLYDEATELYTTVNNSSAVAYISNGQGFLVKAKNHNDDITFHADDRKHGAATFYKGGDQTQRFFLTVANPENSIDETEIVFLDGMSYGLDPSYDAGKYKGNPELSLYSKLVEDNNIDFAIQALPLLTEPVVVPIGFNAGVPGNYSFTVEMQNFEANTPVSLVDKYTSKQVDLISNPQYNFVVDEPGTYNNRFLVYFKSSVGIEENISETIVDFQIYTIGNQVFISPTKEIENYSVSVFNSIGQLALQKEFKGSSNEQINIAPPGAYIVRVVSEQGVTTKKVIVR